MARKGYRKLTPDERARQRRNQERLERVIQERLHRDGMTREEVFRQAGLPDPGRPAA